MNRFLLGMGLAIGVAAYATPARAGNERISDFGSQDVETACLKAKGNSVLSIGAVQYNWGQTSATCWISVEVTASSESQAIANFNAAVQRVGLNGSVSGTYQQNNQWKATGKTETWGSQHFNQRCQEMKAPNGYWLMRASGWRIFIAEGGHACHKGKA